MKSKTTYILLSVFCVLSVNIYAQDYNRLYAKLKIAKSDTAKINALNNLTEAYFGYKNDSAKYFNEQSNALSESKQLSNFFGTLNRAILNRKEKKFDEAEKYAKQALEIARVNNNLLYTTKALEILAIINEHTAKFDMALQYALRAVSISMQRKDTSELMSNLLSVGSIYKRSGKVTEGLKYYLDGLRYAEKLGDNETQFNIYINLGTLYEQSNDAEKALQFYKNAQRINQISNDENGMAICYYKLGSVYTRLQDYKNALIYAKKTVNIHTSQKNEIGLLKSLTLMAGILTTSGKLDESIACYQRVIEMSVRNKDSAQLSAANSGVGYAYFLKEEYKKSIGFYNKAAGYFLGTKNEVGGCKIYERLSKSYEKTNDYKNALKYHLLYVAGRDTMISRNDVKKQTELKLSYEFEKLQDIQKEEAKAKQVENDLRLKQEKQRKNYLWALLILACGVIVVAVRSYINKRKANYKLEKQKVLIEAQKQLVEEKNKEINDSINYAHHIQTACLPGDDDLKILFDNYFVLNKPRDVVSGDFYWTASSGENIFFAVADCTGHGVPGAIMSMIGSILLNEIFYVKKIHSPELILKELNRVVKLTLRQEKNLSSRDGLDIVLCCWNKKTNELNYAGANRPLYIIDEHKNLIEIKPSKMPIGGDTKLDQDYQLNKLLVKSGCQLILNSDGFADQFGGPKFKKITTKRFKNKLVEISNETASTRNKLLEQFFLEWKGENEQTDDVLVFSIDIT